MRHLIRTDDFTIDQINTVLKDAAIFSDGRFDFVCHRDAFLAETPKKRTRDVQAF